MREGTLVLGIGNPIRFDDAVGLRVAERVRALGMPGVTVEEESTSGLEVIDIIMDFRTVIVVDAILTGRNPPGTVTVHRPEDFDLTVMAGSPHEINIFTAFEMGKRIEPDRMPEEIYLVAIEVWEVGTIDEGMTPEVEEAIPKAIRVVVDLVRDQKSREA